MKRREQQKRRRGEAAERTQAAQPWLTEIKRYHAFHNISIVYLSQ